MTSRLLVAVLLAALAFAPPAGAEPLDAASSDALSQTLGALRQTSPGAAGPLDPRLGAIDQSPELQREFSELAADILTELAGETGGDPAQMAGVVSRGKQDPAAFAERLSPATRAKLERLSRKIEAGKR